MMIARQAIEELIERATQARWKHPGTKQRGQEYRFCVICHGEWFVNATPYHRPIKQGTVHFSCPIQELEKLLGD